MMVFGKKGIPSLTVRDSFFYRSIFQRHFRVRAQRLFILIESMARTITPKATYRRKPSRFDAVRNEMETYNALQKESPNRAINHGTATIAKRTV